MRDNLRKLRFVEDDNLYYIKEYMDFNFDFDIFIVFLLVLNIFWDFFSCIMLMSCVFCSFVLKFYLELDFVLMIMKNDFL